MADQLPRMLRAQEVLKARTCSRVALYNDVAAGRFPRPVKHGPMRNAWPESDLVAEQQARSADRDARAAASPEAS